MFDCRSPSVLDSFSLQHFTESKHRQLVDGYVGSNKADVKQAGVTEMVGAMLQHCHSLLELFLLVQPAMGFSDLGDPLFICNTRGVLD
jgi:hypothetical protein